MILYLHGFRSSHLSVKSQLFARYMAKRGQAKAFLSPTLPASPKAAIARCLELVKNIPPTDLAIVGSSLGGYYATYLSQRLACKGVCINPTIYAARDLSTQLEVTTQFHTNEPFSFTREYVRELADLFTPTLKHPERYLLLAGKQDELLDWQEMQHYYHGATHIIDPNQYHAFDGLEPYLPTILHFITGEPS